MMFPKPGKKRRAGIIHRGQRIICRTKSAVDKRNKELYEREQGICQGCGKWLPEDELHPHHVKLKKMGGAFTDDSSSNLKLVCVLCHRLEHLPLKAVPRKVI